MTEAEWLAATRPAELIEFVFFDTPTSDRKLRLFACACAWRVSHLTKDEVFSHLLRTAEAYADGLEEPQTLMSQNTICAARFRELHRSGPPYELVFARHAVMRCGYWAPERKRELYQPHDLDFPYPLGASQDASGATYYAEGGDVSARVKQDAEDRLQVTLLHDIFGNSFRPVTFSPSWRTGTAVTLARTMYDARDFSAMPILADALQDAGCDNDDILSHCRNPGEHVRGCWVVDLVLGKE